MNKHDQNNLTFLLTCNAKQMRDWIENASEDDINYAFELINKATAEFEMQTLEIMDDVEDLTEANNIIKMIMEK